MRTETIKFGDFMKGERKQQPKIKTFASLTAGAGVLTLPSFVFAAEKDDTFGDLYKSIMSLVDGGVVLVIVFAGCCWAIGHRTKAIEILIGVCAGYLLARHAIEIRDWLKGI